MWSHFLQGWNGRPFFLEDEFTATPDISLCTDASGVKGYGAYYQGQWFGGDWGPSQLLVQGNETSIAYHELFPIVLAACIWGDNWSQKRILFCCDNKAAVTAINKGTSSSPLIAKLLRVLTLRPCKVTFLFEPLMCQVKLTVLLMLYLVNKCSGSSIWHQRPAICQQKFQGISYRP